MQGFRNERQNVLWCETTLVIKNGLWNVNKRSFQTKTNLYKPF